MHPGTAGGVDCASNAQVDQRPEHHGHHAAEAVEKHLGNPGTQEGHAGRQPANQHGGCAEGSAQLDEACLEPGQWSHSENGIEQLSGKINAKRVLTLIWQALADPSLLGQFDDGDGSGQVLDRQSDRLEQGDVRRLACPGTAGDNLSQ